MQEHDLYLLRCLELAALGKGKVSPNPLVGALLLHQGRVIEEAYHERYGGPHAEANLVQRVLTAYGPEDAERLFRESTLYVSLEPCAHQGKTPPCADLILKHGIPRVVIAMRDPFDQVDGKGLQKLQEAGVQVDLVEHSDVEAAAHWLNRRFITRVTQKRPYVILKWAQTADGYLGAAPPVAGNEAGQEPLLPEQRWITGAEAKVLVHRWRAEEDAVLVGYRTALIDNPRLNVREWEGGRNPMRVLIDRELSLPKDSHLFDRSQETVVFNAHRTDWSEGLKYVALEHFDAYLPQQILYQLYLMDVQSLIVEGGAETLKQFIQAGLWDEARIFTAATTWGEGVLAPAVLLEQQQPIPVNSLQVGMDRLDVWANPRTPGAKRGHLAFKMD